MEKSCGCNEGGIYWDEQDVIYCDVCLTPIVECPKCKAKGTYITGGDIMIATGNTVPYLYFCTNCKYTWGKNPLW